MSDILFVTVILGFFAISLALVRICEKLMES